MVAVGVVFGEAAELVPGGLGRLRVVFGSLFFGGGAGERPEFEQGAGARGRTGSWRQADSVARRVSWGTAGPFSSGIITATER